MVLSGRFAVWNAEEVLRLFLLSDGLHRLDVFCLAALRGLNALPPCLLEFAPLRHRSMHFPA